MGAIFERVHRVPGIGIAGAVDKHNNALKVISLEGMTELLLRVSLKRYSPGNLCNLQVQYLNVCLFLYLVDRVALVSKH